MNAGLIHSQNFEDALVDTVMHNWRNGRDTYQISQSLTISEATVERSLHIGLERKRNAVVTP